MKVSLEQTIKIQFFQNLNKRAHFTANNFEGGDEKSMISVNC